MYQTIFPLMFLLLNLYKPPMSIIPSNKEEGSGVGVLSATTMLSKL